MLSGYSRQHGIKTTGLKLKRYDRGIPCITMVVTVTPRYSWYGIPCMVFHYLDAWEDDDFLTLLTRI